MMILALLLAATAADGVPAAAALPNPRVAELFAQDGLLNRWALDHHDRNGDGWLTLFEAQAAADDFRVMADTDGDGRVSVREYREARAWLSSRYGIDAGATTR